MTKDEAMAMYESGWWKEKTPREIVAFQLFEPKLCMNFGDFHEAVEQVLGRPVFTHEFGMNLDGLKAEFNGTEPAPTLTEIIDQLPADKTVIVVA